MPAEDTREDHIIYSSSNQVVPQDPDGNYYPTDARFPVKVNMSETDFDDETRDALVHCEDMGGWYCAGEPKPVYSAMPIAQASTGKFDRWHTVLAWVNQDRTPGSLTEHAEQVFVTVGRLDEFTLPMPDRLPIRSTVTPGLACSPDGNTHEFDCLLVYVPLEDTYGNVRTARFTIEHVNSRFKVNLDEESLGQKMRVNLRSASPLLAWSGDGSFYVAIRPVRRLWNQGIEVYRTTDMDSWKLVTKALGYSAIGPTSPRRTRNGTIPVALFAP
jgi:hypothetical protein